ncbi:MAG: Zn-ribbon domain-containing OB-fold protein [Aquisalimonadaceae bacterium]
MTDTDTIEAAGRGPDEIYRENLKQGRLCIQYCTAKKAYIFPPRIMSPGTGSQTLEWREVSGRGEVYSTSVIRRKPDRGGNYNIALIDLEEGSRMMSQVIDVAPEDVTIGMPVQAVIEDRDGEAVVVFRPR